MPRQKSQDEIKKDLIYRHRSTKSLNRDFYGEKPDEHLFSDVIGSAGVHSNVIGENLVVAIRRLCHLRQMPVILPDLNDF